MPLFLQLVIALAVLISAAKLGGYLSLRCGQPAVLGELLAGLILGPSLLNFLHWSSFSSDNLGEIIHCLAEIGVLLLMFIAGLDLHISDLLKSGKVSVVAGTLGVFVPVAMGYGLGRAFSMPALPALFIGLVLAATSVSISAQTLMELNVLHSRVGVALLGAAVFDDILVVLGLSTLVALAVAEISQGLAGVVLIGLRMVTYFVVMIALGFWLLPKWSQKVDQLPISQGAIAFAFVTLLIYAWAAEWWGNMAAITGAFLAGVLFTRSPIQERIQTGSSTLAYAVFVPIFFINVGLSADIYQLGLRNGWLVLAMIGVAIISKLIGAGLGARLSGFTLSEAVQLGTGMISRGEVGLIVATLGVSQGIIGSHIFSAVVGMVIVTTLVTPPLLRLVFSRSHPGTSKVTGIKPC